MAKWTAHKGYICKLKAIKGKLKFKKRNEWLVALEIKIRGLSKAAVSSIDEKAKDLGYKSRNEFLKVYLEREFLLLDKIKEHDSQYNILFEKMLKQLEYNTLVLDKFCNENLIDLEETIKKDRFQEE